MRIDRRGFIVRTAVGIVAGASIAFSANPSLALTDAEATAHVRSTIDEVAALVDSSADPASKAAQLLEIMNRRAAMPEIARFVAGSAWRNMNGDQQTRFVTAFGKFISRVYAAKFQKYSVNGDTSKAYHLGQVTDAGKKGLLVRSAINRPGEAPVAVEWLVTDRPGRVVIADIVIEGVSLLVTEREEIGSMLEARGGDLEKLITDLAA